MRGEVSQMITFDCAGGGKCPGTTQNLSHAMEYIHDQRWGAGKFAKVSLSITKGLRASPGGGGAKL